MKLFPIINENETVVEGTNCKNCMYTKESKAKGVVPGDLNKQGGTIPKTAKETELAKNADLITLPGIKEVKMKAFCNHPKIQQDVTEHMCCAYWDAPGTLRTYGEQIIGK